MRIKVSQSFDTIELTEKEKGKYLLYKGDILFGRRSLVVEGAGKCSWVDNLDHDTTFESSIIRFTPDSSKVYGRFLYNWFQTPKGKQSIAKIRSVVTVAGVRGSDLSKIMIPVPPIDCQKKFISFVEQVDKSKFIVSHSKRI